MTRLPSSSFRMIARGAVVLLVLVTVVVVVTHERKTRNHPAASQTTSQSPAPTTQQVPPASASQADATASASTGQSQLAAHVSGFVAAYNQVLAKDTTSDRRGRLQLLGNWVPPALIAALPLTIDPGSQPDVIRRTQGLTVSGQADTTQLVADAIGSAGDEMQVNVPVVITIKQGDVTRNSYTVISNSTWQYGQAGWTILRYDQGGGTDE